MVQVWNSSLGQNKIISLLTIKLKEIIYDVHKVKFSRIENLKHILVLHLSCCSLGAVIGKNPFIIESFQNVLCIPFIKY